MQVAEQQKTHGESLPLPVAVMRSRGFLVAPETGALSNATAKSTWGVIDGRSQPAPSLRGDLAGEELGHRTRVEAATEA